VRLEGNLPSINVEFRGTRATVASDPNTVFSRSSRHKHKKIKAMARGIACVHPKRAVCDARVHATNATNTRDASVHAARDRSAAKQLTTRARTSNRPAAPSTRGAALHAASASEATLGKRDQEAAQEDAQAQEAQASQARAAQAQALASTPRSGVRAARRSRAKSQRNDPARSSAPTRSSASTRSRGASARGAAAVRSAG
jgi:hypothetical protein